MKSKTKLIVSAVSLFLALVLCVTGMWFLTTLPKETIELPEDDFAGGVIDGNGNELISGKEYEFGSDLTFLSASAKSVTSPEGVTLTAVIEPANATNKNVDWSVRYQDPNVDWVTGKPVTNYVTVTPSADGSLTATVKCLDAFGEQIIITVSSRSNPNITATCTVDYMKRLQSWDFGFEGKTKIAGTENYLFNITDFSLDAPNGGYGDDLMKGEKWLAKASYSLGVGTKTPAISEEIKFKVPSLALLELTNIGVVSPNFMLSSNLSGYEIDTYYDFSSDPLGIAAYGEPEYTMWSSALYFEAFLMNTASDYRLWENSENLQYFYQNLGEYYDHFHYVTDEEGNPVYDEDGNELTRPYEETPFIAAECTLIVNGVSMTKTVGLYMPLSNLEIAVQSIKLNQGGITA